MEQLHTCICCRDDHWFLRETIRAVKDVAPVTDFGSRVARHGTTGDWKKCAELAEADGVNESGTNTTFTFDANGSQTVANVNVYSYCSYRSIW